MNVLNHVYTLTENANGGMGGLSLILMLVVLLAAMYFLMIRPQRKQEREATALRNGLQVGDEITTIGGIIGKIVSIKGETCTIETGKARTKIRILKSAVKCVDVPAAVANGAVPAVESPKESEPAPEGDDQTEPTPEVPEEPTGKKDKKKSKKSE